MSDIFSDRNYKLHKYLIYESCMHVRNVREFLLKIEPLTLFCAWMNGNDMILIS